MGERAHHQTMTVQCYTEVDHRIKVREGAFHFASSKDQLKLITPPVPQYIWKRITTPTQTTIWACNLAHHTKHTKPHHSTPHGKQCNQAHHICGAHWLKILRLKKELSMVNGRDLEVTIAILMEDQFVTWSPSAPPPPLKFSFYKVFNIILDNVFLSVFKIIMGIIKLTFLFPSLLARMSRVSSKGSLGYNLKQFVNQTYRHN